MIRGQYIITRIAQAETIRNKKRLVDVHRTETANKKKLKAFCEDNVDRSRQSQVRREIHTEIFESVLTE